MVGSPVADGLLVRLVGGVSRHRVFLSLSLRRGIAPRQIEVGQHALREHDCPNNYGDLDLRARFFPGGVGGSSGSSRFGHVDLRPSTLARCFNSNCLFWTEIHSTALSPVAPPES